MGWRVGARRLLGVGLEVADELVDVDKTDHRTVGINRREESMHDR